MLGTQKYGTSILKMVTIEMEEQRSKRSIFYGYYQKEKINVDKDIEKM